MIDRIFNLLIGDGRIKVDKFMLPKVKLIPIEITRSRILLPHGLGKVVMNHLLFWLMLGDPTMIVLDPMNVVFAIPSFDPTVFF